MFKAPLMLPLEYSSGVLTSRSTESGALLSIAALNAGAVTEEKETAPDGLQEQPNMKDIVLVPNLSIIFILYITVGLKSAISFFADFFLPVFWRDLEDLEEDTAATAAVHAIGAPDLFQRFHEIVFTALFRRSFAGLFWGFFLIHLTLPA